MKIMIAYDGSERARAALADLQNAGLPREAETKVVAVVEPFAPVGPAEIAWSANVTGALEKMEQEADWVVRQGKQRLQHAFPGWNFETEVYHGLRAAELVARAAEWEPALLVISPLNRNNIERVAQGSLSRKVVENAPCSVRVARNTAEDETRGLRLVVGYDGSGSATMALCEITSRQWPANTQIRLVAALEPPWFGRLGKADADRRQLQRALDRAAQFLRDAGLQVSTSLREGPPKRVLLDEAEQWGAHCIFVGRNRHSAFHRLLLGTTSGAIASQAPCTVEVVDEEWQGRRAMAAKAFPAQLAHAAANTMPCSALVVK